MSTLTAMTQATQAYIFAKKANKKDPHFVNITFIEITMAINVFRSSSI